jgi:4-hydroxy-2-oxoheptanedioate aldolase
MMPSLRRRLREGRPLVTLFSIIAAVEVVELVALAGFEGIILDMEHGSHGTEALGQLILAARAWNTFPIVRVRSNDAAQIGAALDAGAAGVLVPQVSSAAEAARAVRAARFVPEGARGANPWVGAGGYGFAPRWFVEANAATAVLVMIEGADGLRAMREIVAVPGIDSVFLGPVDLSHSLGVPGQISHEKVRSAVATTIDVARSVDMSIGVFAATEAAAATEWLGCGAQLVAAGVDTAHIGTVLRRVVKHIQAPGSPGTAPLTSTLQGRIA